MTGQIRKHLTVSFEDSPRDASSSEIIPPGVSFDSDSTRQGTSEVIPPGGAYYRSEVTVASGTLEPELESCPGDLPSFPALPTELKQALRAGRTPLIEGVDYMPAFQKAPTPPERERADAPPPADKPRIDTLSPTESVPPPAPYLAAPTMARPAVVPPVRSPYTEPFNQRAPIDFVPKGIHSEPPPRIPISDRPSRIGYRSDPPPRLSHSEPPPPMAATVPSSRRRANHEIPLLDSPEALRREAVTIPADAHACSQSGGMDAVKPIPGLRVPTFSKGQLPYTMRQHENNQLRNVAMAMMFVIFIVTGAIAGIRWFVARENERGIRPSSSGGTPSARIEAPEARQPLRATEPRPIEANFERSTESVPEPVLESKLARPAASTAPATPKPAVGSNLPTRTHENTGLNERDPWSQPNSKSKRSNAAATSNKSTSGVDTKTPLFSPRQ